MHEPTQITCLNGRFVRAHRAAVSVADRGFRFGDGVFETIRLVGGVPYQWDEHMARLTQGMAAIHLPDTGADWAGLARKLIAKNQAKEGFIRLAVSRGIGSRGYLPYPAAMPPTYVLEYLPPLAVPTEPYRLWLSQWAKIPARCLPVAHKLAQGLGSSLAAMEAQQHGCDEALQLTTEGMVSETSSANLFWIKDGQLLTPSLKADCLSGTTRDALLRLAAVPVRNVTLGLAALEKAEAVAISNTRLGLHMVQTIEPMGWRFDVAHPIFLHLREALHEDRQRYRKQHAKRWGQP